MKKYDFVIVGGGIIGLTIAREIALRKIGTVLILEKEASLGLHASGRNSGVLHAGIYYAGDSLKAKVCAQGLKEMAAYARERQIPLEKTGKVIVAWKQEQQPLIDMLYERGKANGAAVEKITSSRLRELEPEANAWGEALYSPETSVIDPLKVLKALDEEISRMGVHLQKSALIQSIDDHQKVLKSDSETIGYGHLINAAGQHADKISKKVGVGHQYRILPFKGLYRKLTPEASRRFRGSIYPVPDLRVPFLGVHITRSVTGDVWVGPTATPAFGREHYGLLKGVDPVELPSILIQLALMYVANKKGFRAMVHEELHRYQASQFIREAQRLSPALRAEDFMPGYPKIGIRAQLINHKKNELVMDFVIEKGRASTHILNAVSPAFTSSFAFAKIVVTGLQG